MSERPFSGLESDSRTLRAIFPIVTASPTTSETIQVPPSRIDAPHALDGWVDRPGLVTTVLGAAVIFIGSRVLKKLGKQLTDFSKDFKAIGEEVRNSITADLKIALDETRQTISAMQNSMNETRNSIDALNVNVAALNTELFRVDRRIEVQEDLLSTAKESFDSRLENQSLIIDKRLDHIDTRIASIERAITDINGYLVKKSDFRPHGSKGENPERKETPETPALFID